MATVTLDDVLKLAEQLSPIDKVRLIEHVAPQLERDLRVIGVQPGKSVRGLWKGLSISADEIDSARREMWAEFPRSDY